MDSKKCDVTWINIFFTSSRVNLKPEPNELVEAVAMIGKHHVKQVVYRIQLQTDVQWRSEIKPFNIWKDFKSTLLESLIPNGLVLKWSAGPIPNFKWSGSQISDHIQNSDHLQIDIFLTIQNPDSSIFQIPIVLPFSTLNLNYANCENFKEI